MINPLYSSDSEIPTLANSETHGLLVECSIEGLRVCASLEVVCCVFEKDTLSSAFL